METEMIFFRFFYELETPAGGKLPVLAGGNPANKAGRKKTPECTRSAAVVKMDRLMTRIGKYTIQEEGSLIQEEQ